MKTAVALLVGLFFTACDGIPKDQEGTLDRIRTERIFRVGMIASGETAVDPERRRLFLQRVIAAAGATAQIEQDASERLLIRLEQGELDLVIGELAPKSPWAKQVAILPPLAEQVGEKGHFHLVAAARHGENAWISLLHREAGAVAARR